MGLLVQNYTTEQGFLVPELYIQVSCIRMLKTLGGNLYGMVYTSLAYKSIVERDSGAQPISIPVYLANVEQFLTADQFYDQKNPDFQAFSAGVLGSKWPKNKQLIIDWRMPTDATRIMLFEKLEYQIKKVIPLDFYPDEKD